ncbi:MAG: MerR family transcriptional regulator [Ignavibacteriaceae bacterium]
MVDDDIGYCNSPISLNTVTTIRKMQLINLSQQPINRTSTCQAGIPSQRSGKENDSPGNALSIMNNLDNDIYQENKNLLLLSGSGKILYSLKETASLLGVSYEFVRQNVQAGKVVSINLGDRKMIHINELANLITKGITT